MEVQIRFIISPMKGGVVSRCPEVGLAGHGVDAAMATESLLRAVRAWCAGLQRRGELSRALESRGLRWNPEGGSESVEVVAEVTMEVAGVER